MHSILISAECVADLPLNNPYDDMTVIYYDIQTEEGLFRDTKEIVSVNVLEYMAGGHKKAVSIIPSADDYKYFFEKMLVEYDEIIHIAVSAGISEAYHNAEIGRSRLGRNSSKVFIVDSRNLSSAQAMIAMEAARCREEGMKCKEIVEHLKSYIPRVEISFLAFSADYLCYNGKVGKNIMNICNSFHLHPLLKIVNGKLTVKGVYVGNYRKCASRYIRKTLGNCNNIDRQVGFLTYVGCSEDQLDRIRRELDKRITFKNLYEGPASTTVSCNSGPSTFGIIFAREEKA